MPSADSRDLTTGTLLRWVVELHAGRPSAAEPEFRRILSSVQRLATAMFQKFRRVGRFAEVDDVLNGSMVRLLSALRAIRPKSTREFYALANTAIRRELLDLIKRFYGPCGAGTNASAVGVGGAVGEVEPVTAAEDLDRMTAFHEAVQALPAESREAFGLRYYHGWSQVEIGNLFGVSVKTVERWQADARVLLRASGHDGSE